MICCISGCAGASGSEKLLTFLRPPFYSLLGSLQRLCDTKGHTTQCWKCHKHHTSLHSTTDEKSIRHYEALCCAAGFCCCCFCSVQEQAGTNEIRFIKSVQTRDCKSLGVLQYGYMVIVGNTMFFCMVLKTGAQVFYLFWNLYLIWMEMIVLLKYWAAYKTAHAKCHNKVKL